MFFVDLIVVVGYHSLLILVLYDSRYSNYNFKRDCFMQPASVITPNPLAYLRNAFLNDVVAKAGAEHNVKILKIAVSIFETKQFISLGVFSLCFGGLMSLIYARSETINNPKTEKIMKRVNLCLFSVGALMVFVGLRRAISLGKQMNGYGQ